MNTYTFDPTTKPAGVLRFIGYFVCPKAQSRTNVTDAVILAGSPSDEPTWEKLTVSSDTDERAWWAVEKVRRDLLASGERPGDVQADSKRACYHLWRKVKGAANTAAAAQALDM